MKIPSLISVLILGTVSTLAVAQADQPSPPGGDNLSTAEPDKLAAKPGSMLQPQEALNAYQQQMALVAIQTYGELAQIAQAVRTGQISSERAGYLTSRSYELGIIRLQFFDTLHQITEANLSKESTHAEMNVQPPADQASDDTLVVAPPDSSPDIPESLARYLDLTPTQIAAIQARVAEVQRQMLPLLQRLSHNREALTAAIHGTRSKNSNRRIRQLAAEQSHILERIIVAGSRLQRDIYKTLTDAQRERLDDSGEHVADAIEQWSAGR